MKLNDDRNDPSEIEEKYRNMKEITYGWRMNEFKDHQDSVKKRTTKKKTYLVTDEHHNFW